MPTRRFAVVPVTATILKVLAVMTVLISAYMLGRSIPNLNHLFDSQGGPSSLDFWNKLDIILSSQMNPIVSFLQQLWLPTLLWVLADFGLSSREIEFNTRRCVPAELQETEPEAWEAPVLAPADQPVPPVMEPPTATPPAAQ